VGCASVLPSLVTTTNTPSSPRVFAVIAGGGTAGHIIPALAIAEQLVDRGRSPRSIAFVASRRPSDERLLSGSDYPRLLLDVDGLQRSVAPKALWRSLLALPKLLIATARATRQFRLWRPRVVVSVGGFASEPAVRAAGALRIPVVVVSYIRAWQHADKPGRLPPLLRHSRGPRCREPSTLVPQSGTVFAVCCATRQQTKRHELLPPQSSVSIPRVASWW
jgi:hypothetical protein